MNQSVNIQGYLDTVDMPWGKLFYHMIWHNLNCESKKILDFGSGFGITANHLAEKNEVTAIEPNEEMLVHRRHEYDYRQVKGGIDKLREMPDNSYDVVLCHNVLEYIENRDELIHEFVRVMKPDGFLSIVKHNKAGKIMQKAVFEYKIDEAMELLRGEDMKSLNFGMIKEYDDSELNLYSCGCLKIEKTFGVRTFFALQRNEVKREEDWLQKMFQLECMVEERPEFRDIAFFHHIILSHTK